MHFLLHLLLHLLIMSQWISHFVMYWNVHACKVVIRKNIDVQINLDLNSQNYAFVPLSSSFAMPEVSLLWASALMYCLVDILPSLIYVLRFLYVPVKYFSLFMTETSKSYGSLPKFIEHVFNENFIVCVCFSWRIF